MTRRKGNRLARMGADRLQQGLDRLKVGRWASPAVCRELLGLDYQPDQSEIVQAVHNTIHSWQKDRDTVSLGNVVAALQAGIVLLRMVRK